MYTYRTLINYSRDCQGSDKRGNFIPGERLRTRYQSSRIVIERCQIHAILISCWISSVITRATNTNRPHTRFIVLDVNDVSRNPRWSRECSGYDVCHICNIACNCAYGSFVPYCIFLLIDRAWFVLVETRNSFYYYVYSRIFHYCKLLKC